MITYLCIDLRNATRIPARLRNEREKNQEDRISEKKKGIQKHTDRLLPQTQHFKNDTKLCM